MPALASVVEHMLTKLGKVFNMVTHSSIYSLTYLFISEFSGVHSILEFGNKNINLKILQGTYILVIKFSQ